jgi:hypothetical protein
LYIPFRESENLWHWVPRVAALPQPWADVLIPFGEKRCVDPLRGKKGSSSPYSVL